MSFKMYLKISIKILLEVVLEAVLEVVLEVVLKVVLEDVLEDILEVFLEVVYEVGNQKGISIQHYLIKMVHRILSVLDNNSKTEAFAVIANLIDWNNAFPRQCPKLGIESFVKNGVRPALIPVLINYFQDREMSVRWHGQQSVPRRVNGGGPQGATIGILEYLSQSNDCADLVRLEDRFRFVDDLTVLEAVNLVTIGITSHNLKAHIPSDLGMHNQYIPSQNLKSQD